MKRLLARYAALSAAVVVLNFLLPRFLPGDPLDALDAASATGRPGDVDAHADPTARHLPSRRAAAESSLGCTFRILHMVTWAGPSADRRPSLH